MLSKLKLLIYNLNYFFKEAVISIRQNLLNSLFSSISIGLVFFVLAMITASWWASSYVVDIIREEAEISVYFNEDLQQNQIVLLTEEIQSIHGVKAASIVEQQEAYDKMVNILGKEADVLEVFDENPFSAYIEVNLDLEQTDLVLSELNLIEGIEHIRDNEEILAQLGSIVQVLSYIGYLGMIAVGASTLVITSNTIRMGIYSRRDHIITLRLLGAPELFIGAPFLLEGIIIALSGGIVATALVVSVISFLYSHVSSTLSFIPLLPLASLITSLTALIILLSITFGIVGSLVGLSSAKKV